MSIKPTMVLLLAIVILTGIFVTNADYNTSNRGAYIIHA